MIMQKLKESTRQQHEHVEGTVDVMSQLFSLDDYKRLIGKFWAFYAAFEPTLPYADLKAAGLDYDSAEASFVPSMNVELDKDGAAKAFRLVEALEDLDDVQNVFANFDVPDDVMAELEDADA